MKLRPALLASVIGIYVLSVIAAIYVGARLAGRLPSLLSFHGSAYYAHWKNGDDDSNRGNYADAIREYGKMVAMRPDKVEGYTYRAIAERRAGLYDRAIQDDTTGIELLTERKGIEEQGAPQGMSYQEQLASVPHSQSRLYQNRGIAYDQLGDMRQATRDLKQAIALEPDAPADYGSLSLLYQRAGQYGLDAANWKNAIVSIPDSSYCWRNYGWARYELGNYPEAIDASLHAIRINPKAVTARYNLALCYAVEDRWSLAEPVYRDALARQNTRANTEAMEHVRAALKIHPQSHALQNAAALLSGS